MDNEVRKKIAACKALQNATVEDIINSDRFRGNLDAYLRAQKEDRKAAQCSLISPGFKLSSHPVDKFMDYTVGDLANEYVRVLQKVSVLPAAQRAFVFQLGQQAYALTVAQIVCEEFPELESILIPKSKAN